MRWCQYSTPTPMPPLWAPAHGVEWATGTVKMGRAQQWKEDKPWWQNQHHRTTLTPIMRGQMTTTLMRGQPPQDDDRNEMETYNNNHMTKMAAAVHDEGGWQAQDKNRRCRWQIQCCTMLRRGCWGDTMECWLTVQFNGRSHYNMVRRATTGHHLPFHMWLFTSIFFLS